MYDEIFKLCVDLAFMRVFGFSHYSGKTKAEIKKRIYKVEKSNIASPDTELKARTGTTAKSK